MAEIPALPRVAVVGVSESEMCGVRDHATLLSQALGHEGIACSTHWLSRHGATYGEVAAEFGAWRERLSRELPESGAGAILLHYSVFSYSFRGVPLFVAPLLATLRASGLPIVVFMHELAYPWHLGGVRGKVWSLSQRALLLDVVRSSEALVVSAPFRVEWLTSRVWLPRRRVEFAPVFSNLPAPAGPPAHGAQSEPPTIGLFGYAYEGAASALVLDAIRLLADRGIAVHLELLGAPGSDSPSAQAWSAGARSRGLEDAVSFSGVLCAQQLSDALARCEVLIHAEPSGPTSRKGTLAASLAAGRPVVAIDGPLRWQELLDAQAALVVQPSSVALADALATLLGDEARAEALGARGRAFAETSMGVARSAQVLRGVLGKLSRAASG
jgi:glycosyltransferase involved in cell wall biosynthesis